MSQLTLSISVGSKAGIVLIVGELAQFGIATSEYKTQKRFHCPTAPSVLY